MTREWLSYAECYRLLGQASASGRELELSAIVRFLVRLSESYRKFPELESQAKALNMAALLISRGFHWGTGDIQIREPHIRNEIDVPSES